MTEGWENEGGSVAKIDEWHLQRVDMSVMDEDELAALIDDVCDHDVSLLFTEAGGVKPLAVAIPYDRWLKIISRADGDVEPWHGRARSS